MCVCLDAVCVHVFSEILVTIKASTDLSTFYILKLDCTAHFYKLTIVTVCVHFPFIYSYLSNCVSK